MIHSTPGARTGRAAWMRPALFGWVVWIGGSLAAASGWSAEGAFPGRNWQTATPRSAGMERGLLERAKRYAQQSGGAGIVVRHGRVVMAWGDTRERFDLKSSTKAIGVTALGLALMDGKVKLSDRAREYHPRLGIPPESNARTGWLDEITLEHLATQTAGFDKPGGYEKLLFRPGTMWYYSDGGPNWLAECLTLCYRQDLRQLLFDRVFTPIGITPEDLTWRENAYRPAEIDGMPRREFGSGISACVDAMARIGLLYLRGGRWNDRRILPASFVRMVGQPLPPVVDLPEYVPAGSARPPQGNASAHYGLLWWNNADGTLEHVPRDAYWSWGLFDSLIVVVPSLDIVVARAGKSFPRVQNPDWDPHYGVLRPFFEPIVRSVTAAERSPESSDSSGPPYPPSRAIRSVAWAPRASIVRRACGSDNWPLTWADDGDLYAAYGDGRGFRQAAAKKLSMGFARITGPADDFRGTNIEAPAGEAVGDGPRGEKASGLLMVDRTLYLWVRNVGNAQLRWSADHGRSWQRADWKFTTSFGCPTFVNFGKNYAGARDDFVYIVSHDSRSAYQPADRMVAARVPRELLTERGAYEFFQRLDEGGEPVWTREIERRGAVFSWAGNCYRSGITYNAGLDRYLWCQTLPPRSGGTRGPRFEGGLGIYDAPEPWGPWTTVYFTRRWDVGPGETSCFPTKWMSNDGRTAHLVFSGNDCFSVRRVHFDP